MEIPGINYLQKLKTKILIKGRHFCRELGNISQIDCFVLSNPWQGGWGRERHCWKRDKEAYVVRRPLEL